MICTWCLAYSTQIVSRLTAREITSISKYQSWYLRQISLQIMLLSIKITNWKVSVNPNLIFLNEVISLLYFNKKRLQSRGIFSGFNWLNSAGCFAFTRYWQGYSQPVTGIFAHLCTAVHNAICKEYWKPSLRQFKSLQWKELLAE